MGGFLERVHEFLLLPEDRAALIIESIDELSNKLSHLDYDTQQILKES